MGWWKDHWDKKKIEVGDEPIDLIHEMLRAFANSYAEDMGRKPVTREFLFCLFNAMQTSGRDMFGDLESQEVVSVNLTTKKATKIQDFEIGDYFTVPLKQEFAFGRIIGHDAAGSVIEIFRLKTKKRLSFSQLQHQELSILFQTHVNGLSAFRDRRWPIVGHANLPKNHPMPSFRLGHHATFWQIACGDKNRVATTEEVLHLEPISPWTPETVEERIISDDPVIFPEMEAMQCSDFGDAYLKIMRQPNKLQTLNCYNTVTDSGLQYVARCNQLKILRLVSQPITDTGLKHLAGLVSLEELSLRRTRVMDAGLRHLYGLKHLRKLVLAETAVSDQAVAKLKKALPDVVVER
ncbi:MAG TPA: Imm26 family immunity protein [Gemmataceae bacterium]|nr:Imm26 family immunity protein [Gemmataceae bacterium]